MSNFVYNKVICDKETLEKYFIDYCPTGDDILEKPYISLNKIFGLNSFKEYWDNISNTYIYYGNGFSYKLIDEDIYEIMFCTLRKYPIHAINRLIELSKNSVWYAVEENMIYISKFVWGDNGVQEKVMDIEKGYDDWLDYNLDAYDYIDYCDSDVWYYLKEVEEVWVDIDDNIRRAYYYE